MNGPDVGTDLGSYNIGAAKMMSQFNIKLRNEIWVYQYSLLFFELNL